MKYFAKERISFVVLVELVLGDLLGEGGDQGLALVLVETLGLDQDLRH